MAGALETLCAQAYGAGQNHKLGIFTCCAMISLISVCFPVSFLWIYMENLLKLLGQNELISGVAGRYSSWLIPALFAYAVLQSMIRYFLAQSLIIPMLIRSFAVLCFHIPLCWALVFKLKLGIIGAALAIDVSYWLNVIVLAFYVKNSLNCEGIEVRFSEEFFVRIREFFHLAVPSAIMVCMEWWSSELLILLSGLLPDPALETSAVSICLTTATVLYLIPFSIGSAASIRISNELGPGNPQAAPVAVTAAMVLADLETLLVSIIMLCCRHILGYAYTKCKEVVDYVAELVPLLSLISIADSLQSVLPGVARGSGWQNIGAYVNIGAYYLVGVPLAAVLAFLLHYGGKGLLIGFLIGVTVWQPHSQTGKNRQPRQGKAR